MHVFVDRVAMIAAIDRLRATLAARYQIEREIGTGGMATVYVARDLRHHRKVAIKVLRPELAAAIGAERFLQEIQLTANLQHPHILPLFDSGDADGLLFFVMPYVEGETLRARLEREQRLPVNDAVRLAGEVADAVDYAHRQGIIHRDIKPENILLHEGRALVADFGIALAGSSSAARITATGISLGTPHYMSPEQALGQGDVGPRSDIYSLGAMLYEMLTGAPPFTGPTAQAIVARVITETPVPPARIRPEVPPAMSGAVLRALDKNPDHRFATAAAFHEALRDPAATRPTRFRAWPAAAALLVLAAGAGVLLRGRRGGAERDAAAATMPRRVAVIPFRSASGDTTNSGFSEGLSLEINDALSRLPGLTVVVAASARYRVPDLDVAALGRELDVDAVLSGRVDTADSLVRVQVQLQDVRTRALRWSAKYDRPRRDLYLLEDSLSQAIAADLRIASAGPAPGTPGRARTASPEAHALLLQARGNAERRTPAALAAAITLFTAAINLDSSYAQAWAGRANAENLTVAFNVRSPREFFPLATADVTRALQLDSTAAEAHATLGFIHVFYDRDWPAAAAEFTRALALDSTAAQTWLYRGWYYVAVNRFDSAAAAMRTASRLDPGAPINPTRLGTVLYLAGDMEGAKAALAEALRRDSGYVFAHQQLAQVYAEEGRCEQALAEAYRTVRSPDPAVRAVDPRYDAVYAQARCGEAAEARRFAAQAEARAREGGQVDPFFLSLVFAALHNEPKVFEWLNRAVANRSSTLFWLRAHPAFKPWRNDPRFQALVREVYQSGKA